ncbi:MAG: hypothetical protein KKA97_10365 [Actinobacteria bacterium]|nr:hypothetical protein [Actinomycetota bacterium]
MAAGHLALTPVAAAWAPAVLTSADGEAETSVPAAWVARPLTLVSVVMSLALWGLPVPFATTKGGDLLYMADPGLIEPLAWQTQALFDLAVLAGISVWGLLALGVVAHARWVAEMGLHALAAFYGCVVAFLLCLPFGLWPVGGLTPNVGFFLFLTLGPLVLGVYRVGAALGAYPPWREVAPDGPGDEPRDDGAAR